MTRTMTEISSIRKDLISQRVLQCLDIMDIRAYPVNPRTLVKSLYKKSKGKIPVILETYSSYSDFLGKSVEDLIISPFNSSEGATVYLQDIHLNAIFYNDTVSVSGRINWTIAHELGHVMLEHYRYMDPIVLGSSAKPAESSAILEKEADLFAKYLLCHPLILWNSALYDPAQISKICRVSREAAANTAKESKIHNMENRFGNWDMEIVKRFHNFIHTYKCGTCHKIFISSPGDASFCPVCRSSGISWYSGPQKRYQKDYGGYFHSSFPNQCENPACEACLEQDARYCHSCGSKSTYFSQNLLSPWKF